MTTPLIVGLTALASLLLGLLIRRLTKGKKPRVAGAQSPIRFSRQSLQEQSGAKKSASGSRLKALAIWGGVAVLIAWVVLAVINRKGDAAPIRESANSQAPAQQNAPPPLEYSASLSGKLEPFPAPGSNPSTNPNSRIPSLQELAGLPASEANADGNASAAPNAGNENTYTQPLNGAQPSNSPDASADDASTFAPPVNDNPYAAQALILQAAQAMAPQISRMEPVGRQLTPKEQTEPQKNKPNNQEQAKPRLTSPPPPQQQTASTSVASTGKFTVLLGSFGKSENADTLKNKLLDAGLPVTVSEVTLKNKVWFRVMSGSFDDQSSAEAYGRELKQRNLVDNPYIKPM
ncbi:MAG: SPOR domain-containing protein [Deltaproteobacteria bacterium]|jgi:cell division protein FtsN|nr:SPOR domain-containing protein [Deltaproteobacteria bacterium]